MASLQSRLSDLITAIGTDIKLLRTYITGSSTGDLTGLTTTAKTSVVAAINEVKAGNAGAPPAASETVAGVMQIATQAETDAGTIDTDAVSPLKFATRMAAYAQPLDSDLTAIAAVATTAYGRAFLALANQAALMTLIPAASTTTSGVAAIGTQVQVDAGTNNSTIVTPLTLQTRMAAYAMPLSYLDTDVALAANSDTKVASQKAVKAYADALIAANDAMVFRGVIDASLNPNYPAANRGDTYKISVAGKIGGASGVNVEVGDLIMCITDATVAGTQAAVGANWEITQANIDGAVTGPTSSTSGNLPSFSGTTGKVIADSGFSASNGAIGAGSATVLPTSAQVVAYAQPLDADLTAIAAVTTTSYGRAFLALANQAGLVALIPQATTTQTGIAMVALQTDVTTGTDDTKMLTSLKYVTDFTTRIGNPDTDLVALYTTAKS
jgi:hypothetical protein